MRRRLCRCQTSIIALVPCCQAGVVTHILMALLPSMHRCLCHHCHCNCPAHDDSVVAVVHAQASLPLSNCCHCPLTMPLLPLIHDFVVALVMMASMLSSNWCYCPCCNGVIIIIDVIAFAAHWQSDIIAVDAQVLLPLLQWQLSLLPQWCCCRCQCAGVSPLLSS